MITVNKGTCFLLLMGLLQGCVGSSQHTGVWNAAAEPGAGLDAVSRVNDADKDEGLYRLRS